MKDLENLQQRNQTIITFGRDRPIENAHPFELHSRQKNKYGKFHVCAMEMKHRNHGAIAEHDSRPKWFIGMVCTKEFGIFIFSGGVSFTK